MFSLRTNGFAGIQSTSRSWPFHPKKGVDTLLGSMRSIHFDVQGFSRTYWDLFVAAGFPVGEFYLFAAALAWQPGGLAAETWHACELEILLIIPIVFSMLIIVCLTAAAWLSAKAS